MNGRVLKENIDPYLFPHRPFFFKKIKPEIMTPFFLIIFILFLIFWAGTTVCVLVEGEGFEPFVAFFLTLVVFLTLAGGWAFITLVFA